MKKYSVKCKRVGDLGRYSLVGLSFYMESDGSIGMVWVEARRVLSEFHDIAQIYPDVPLFEVDSIREDYS